MRQMRKRRLGIIELLVGMAVISIVFVCCFDLFNKSEINQVDTKIEKVANARANQISSIAIEIDN